jgi:hypothetical protein
MMRLKRCGPVAAAASVLALAVAFRAGAPGVVAQGQRLVVFETFNAPG